MNKNVSPDRKFLIDRLGYFRIKADFSAKELSERIGKSKSYIAKFENGDMGIPAEVLLDAIKVCGTTPEEFFYSNPQDFAENKELFEIIKSLSSENKTALLNLAKKLKQ